MKWLFSILFLALTEKAFSFSLPTDTTYYAGVVEFQPEHLDTSKASMKENMRRMKNIIESDETTDMDILVFPEFVLNNLDFPTFVPDPADMIAPCEIPDYDFFLTELSCSARSRQLYVVINVVEKAYCGSNASCPASGYYTYNTNVVFDRRGRVISRYRKTHLYRYEWYTENVLAVPETAVFTTDFGVTFGHFICFDMLFYDTAQVLIDQMNITDIIYPTYWFSELPFLTAVQLQEGWAYANNVNLLAADGSYPQGQNTGSGIYAGRFGRLTAAIYESPTTVVLKARVPKRNSNAVLPPAVVPVFRPQQETARLTKLDMLRDYNLEIFTTKSLDENFLTATDTVCHHDFCCEFTVQRREISPALTTPLTSYRYRLVAYNGSDTTHQRIDRSELSVCAIVACTSVELHSCGRIFPDGIRVSNKYYFESITVKGSFRKADKRVIMPSSVDGLIMPLPVSSYDMVEVDGTTATDVTLTMTQPKNDLLTYGLWGNYYSSYKTKHNLNSYWYPAEETRNNSHTSYGNIFILGLCLLLGIKNIF